MHDMCSEGDDISSLHFAQFHKLLGGSGLEPQGPMCGPIQTQKSAHIQTSIKTIVPMSRLSRPQEVSGAIVGDMYLGYLTI